MGVFVSNSAGVSLCHTPIKPDLLGFPGIGVFVCGLRDHVITRFASLTYARVCVKIDASKLLVKEFNLQCPNGMVITISVEYEGLPSRCGSCNVFSHNLATCPNNNNDKASVMREAKKKKGGDGTTLAYNLQNHFFNRRRLESRRTIKRICLVALVWVKRNKY